SNLNFNSNTVAAIENLSVGPTVSASKLLIQRKVRSTFTSSYIRSFQSGELLSENITARIACNYATKTKHTFGVDLSWLKRISDIENIPTFSEFRGGITYNYSFS